MKDEKQPSGITLFLKRNFINFFTYIIIFQEFINIEQVSGLKDLPSQLNDQENKGE